MKSLVLPLSALALACFPLAFAETETKPAAKPAPLKVLYLTGGGYHDYEGQRAVIEAGLPARLNLEIETAMVKGGNEAPALHPKTATPGWWKGYDAILYNICNCANTEDKTITDALVSAQKEGKVPAVFMHCTMHCLRKEPDGEFPKILGVTSRNHEKHAPVTITKTNSEHPVMAGFPEKWELEVGELYRILDAQPEMVPLATGISGEKQPHTTIWEHTYNGVPLIGTTIGHHTETVATDTYLDLISRSLLHVTGNINKDGSAAEGYGPAPKSE